MPDFWGSVGDGNQQPGQFRGPGGTSPVGGLGDGGPNYWGNYFSTGATGAAPASVPLNTTNADQARGWQQQLMQDLQRQAAGDPNSRAQQSLTQGYTDARAGQSALGSAARGTGGAAGLRAGVMGGGNVQRGYAGDQQMLLVQEKQAAQAALAQQMAAQRAQDGQQAQMMAANTLGNASLDNAMRQFYEGQSTQQTISNAQFGIDNTRMQLGLDNQSRRFADDQRGAAMSALGTGAAAAGGFFNTRGSTGGYRQVDGQDSIVPDWDK